MCVCVMASRAKCFLERSEKSEREKRCVRDNLQPMSKARIVAGEMPGPSRTCPTSSGDIAVSRPNGLNAAGKASALIGEFWQRSSEIGHPAKPNRQHVRLKAAREKHSVARNNRNNIGSRTEGLTKYSLEKDGMWLLPTPVAKLKSRAPLSETARARRNTDRLVWQIGGEFKMRNDSVFMVTPENIFGNGIEGTRPLL